MKCINFDFEQVLGKITEEGVFVEQLETNPSKYLPEVQEKDLTTEVVQVCQSYCCFKHQRGNNYHMSILIDCFTAQLRVKY